MAWAGWVRATLALSVLVATATAAGATDSKSLKKEFKTLYDRQADLLRHRDVAGFMAYNAPEYSVKLLDGGTVGRDQLEQGMSSFFTSGQLVRQISFGYTLKEVTMQGDEAVVLVEQKDKRVQIRKDGKPHRVEANVIHRETWKQTPEGWKRRLTEEVRQTKFTVDGKEKT